MESKASVYRRWRRTFVIIACIWAVGLLSAGRRSYKAYVHSRWRRHVELLILRLAPKRPADVTSEDWAHCLIWTWNLHANYGYFGCIADDQREPLVREFERLLDEPVTLNSIDQIWDEYIRRNPRANAYLRFRPMIPKMLQPYSTTESLDSWVKKWEERERERK